jgi:hypothetical protein
MRKPAHKNPPPMIPCEHSENKKGCEPPRPQSFLGVLFHNYMKYLTCAAIVVTTYFSHQEGICRKYLCALIS